MTKVTIHAAKTNLSKLIAKVEAGEEVVICRGNVEVARLVPAAIANDTGSKRKPGRFKGQFKIDDRFFEPLPAEYLGAE
ncbi:MAG: type II toxin-antitoxin system prevent-host-death family antitoxin [Terricaulis sp.]|nr:type II toxin-antitoxin system prevent-host-death family antitoxin [Terricaulis sp.]